MGRRRRMAWGFTVVTRKRYLILTMWMVPTTAPASVLAFADDYRRC